MSYSRVIPIEFCHCDPAGIVFYPRYAEMVNHMVENFFIDEVGYSFARMMAEGFGMPTARLEVDFRKPSRLGDRLEWLLSVEHVGRSSARFLVRAEDRVEARSTVVWMDRGFTPAPWPGHIRPALEAHHA
ncbi:acyl-CoA thioesterase [Paracoccus siganidrum]|uniref:Acyl-CoA thioesterase n=1 Tax=Paracoccus siganidrum TaxID=1276757 RepID=A0A419A692_9RHOB|nr:acyl-CoA thioesterase [Paracoccus siganidrum]RJL14182.1 acyl-CoA thioesterase [Paracoccus siganidrum]RMC33486.1 acyl-CoA thioesterase [Paracoccus siganidrum]